MKDIDLGKVSFTPRGTYDQTETYEWLDVVFSGPASFVSIRDENTNHPLTDPNYWMPLVDCRFILDYIRENGLEAAWIKVRDNATIGGKTIIRGGLDVGGDAHFYQNVQIDGKLTGVEIPGGGGGGGSIDGDSIETILEYLRRLNSDLRNKLSRVDEDEAEAKIGFLQGLWIKAKNLFWWDADGNIKANDIEGNNILGNEVNANNVFATNSMKALKGFYNIIQSHNFTGHSQEDTGWILTNAYDGHSKLTVDELYVRMKAVFEELEVRKWTYVGGNFILSAAGSRIIKVDYYDKEVITDEDEPLGYKSIDLPWGLVGQIFGAGSLVDWLNKAGRYLGFWGAEKKIFVGLTPEEKASVKTFRCYLYTDDGTTQTMNWWQKGDQAKCQTFNQVTDKLKQEGSFSGKAANTYYWRLVTGVGTAEIDGRMYDYVDLSKDTCQPGITNDEPSAGDAIVQMGYRGTDKTRQNMITLEVTGEDAPAIKEYMGINTFSLEGKRRTMISPKSGNEFYATRFVIVTEYGDNRVPADRGLWVDITREKGDYGEKVRYPEDTADSTMVRKCYYYDRVAHNGAYWLCIVPEGTHWVNGSGNYISENDYAHLTDEEKALCQRKPNYTALEPSDENPSVWQRHISAGIAPYLSLSSIVIPVNCEKDSTASEALTKEVEVRLKVTNLDCDLSSVSVTPADSHVSVQLTPGASSAKITFSYAAKEAISVKDFVVTAKGKLNKQEYNDTDAISVYPVMKGDDAYTIFSTPDNMIYEQEGASLTYEQILEDLQKPEQERTLSFNIITEDATTQSGYKEMAISVLKDGQTQPFSIGRPIPSDNRINVGFDNPTKRVWIVYIPNTISMGHIDVPVTYGNSFVHTLRIPFYCNLMGTWRQMIVGDTDAAIATKTEFDYTDDEGNVQHINIRNFWAAYVRSSKETLARFLSVEGTIKSNKDAADEAIWQLGSSLNTLNTNFGEFKQSAEGEFNTVKSDITTVNTNLSEEIINRQNAIDNAISNEVSNRNNAIDSAISTEVTNRNNAIDALKNGDVKNALDTLAEHGTLLNQHTSQIGKVVTTSGGFTTDFTQEVNSLIGTSVSSGDIKTALNTEVTNRNKAIGDAKTDLLNGAIKNAQDSADAAQEKADSADSKANSNTTLIQQNQTKIGKLTTGFNGMFGKYSDTDVTALLDANIALLSTIEAYNKDIADVQDKAKLLRSDLANVNDIFDSTLIALFNKYSVSYNKNTYPSAFESLRDLIDEISQQRDSAVNDNTSLLARIMRENTNNFNVTSKGLQAEISSRNTLENNVNGKFTTVDTDIANLKADSKEFQSKYTGISGILLNDDIDLYNSIQWANKTVNVSASSGSSFDSMLSDDTAYLTFLSLIGCVPGRKLTFTIYSTYYFSVYYFDSSKQYLGSYYAQTGKSSGTTLTIPDSARFFAIRVNKTTYATLPKEEYQNLNLDIIDTTDSDVSISLISQTAKNIRLQVQECGINIDEKCIELNGDTKINGTLTVNSTTDGFELTDGNGSSTRIVAQGVPNNIDTFRQQTGITEYLTLTAQNSASEIISGTYKGYYDCYLYFIKAMSSPNVTFGISQLSFANKFYNYCSLITAEGKILTRSNVQFKEILRYEMSGSNLWISVHLRLYPSSFPSSTSVMVQTPYIRATIVNFQVTIPTNTFTLIGYNGMAMNLGGNIIYFHENEATILYKTPGSSPTYSGIKITSNGVMKQLYNTWVPINARKRQVMNSASDTIDDDTEVVVCKMKDITYKLPTSNVPLGRRIDFVNETSGQIKIGGQSGVYINGEGGKIVDNDAKHEITTLILVDPGDWVANYGNKNATFDP